MASLESVMEPLLMKHHDLLIYLSLEDFFVMVFHQPQQFPQLEAMNKKIEIYYHSLYGMRTIKRKLHLVDESNSRVP